MGKPFCSKIHGTGFQAIARMAKGEIVAASGGIIILSEEFDHLEKTLGSLGIQ